MTGSMTYLWEEAQMGSGATPHARCWTIELLVEYYATKYIPAKVDCDPDDGHPPEGGDLVVENARVVSIKQDGRRVELTQALASYWEDQFERQKLTEGDFWEELIQHVDGDDTVDLPEDYEV